MPAPGDVPTRILEAMCRLMPSVGTKVSMADVCREAGVARATLYKYFANRDELFDAMAAYHVERFREAIEVAVDADPAPERRFQVVVRTVNARLDRNRPGAERFRDNEADFMLSQLQANWTGFATAIRDAIVDAFPAGTTRRHRIVSVAAELIARTSFAQMMLPTAMKETDVVEMLGAFAASKAQAPP